MPLLTISALPVRTASAVMNFNSDTRMPVAQMVCRIRASRSFSDRSAAWTRRAYSARDSSRPSSRNRAFWIFSSRTDSSRQPIKARKPLTAASMELTVDGAWASMSWVFQPISAVLVSSPPSRKSRRAWRSWAYFCRVAGLRSCSRRCSMYRRINSGVSVGWFCFRMGGSSLFSIRILYRIGGASCGKNGPFGLGRGDGGRKNGGGDAGSRKVPITWASNVLEYPFRIFQYARWGPPKPRTGRSASSRTRLTAWLCAPFGRSFLHIRAGRETPFQGVSSYRIGQ